MGDRITKTTTIVIHDDTFQRPEFQASLVGLSGSVFGQRFPLAKDEVRIGRDLESCDIIIDDSGVSRVHARILRERGKHRLVDMGSKNGCRINGSRVADIELKDGDLIAIGTSVLKYLKLNAVEVDYHDKMSLRSNTDQLTGLFNRRHAWEVIDQEVARAIRHKRPLSLVLLDIDHFKRVNDTKGHAAGDACLVGLARLVAQACRREDTFARVGGEEFLIVLPDCEILEAAELATRVRDLVAGSPMAFEGETIPLTVSLGVTDLEELRLSHGVSSHAGDRTRTVDLFVTLADAKLYEAKNLGRNRVVV
ncbi:MAG: diguanylate cyclase (GGDEF)-like protein [Bradymonadia bacterium]|jgi:diguanylate cyclase (GGDEF)-like protein